MRMSPSLLPQEIQSSFNCFLAFSGSGTSSSGRFVFGADEKPPTHANVSRFARPKFRDCPPPIERPASARLSRSFFHRIFCLQEGNKIAEQILVELPKGGRSGHRVCAGAIVRLRAAV